MVVDVDDKLMGPRECIEDWMRMSPGDEGLVLHSNYIGDEVGPIVTVESIEWLA